MTPPVTPDDNRLFPATAMPDSDWWQALWPDPAAVLRKLGVTPAMAVVDLCCGDGHFTAPLAALAAMTYAVDLDPAMLALAARRLSELGLDPARYRLIEGDARALPDLIDGPVDYVLHANTFHGVPDRPGLAKAVAAALKPGGRFAIINWHRRPREETTVLDQPRGPRTDLRMTPEDTRAAVEPAGLRLEAVIELPPYHYACVFGKTPG